MLWSLARRPWALQASCLGRWESAVPERVRWKGAAWDLSGVCGVDVRFFDNAQSEQRAAVAPASELYGGVGTGVRQHSYPNCTVVPCAASQGHAWQFCLPRVLSNGLVDDSSASQVRSTVSCCELLVEGRAQTSSLSWVEPAAEVGEAR